MFGKKVVSAVLLSSLFVTSSFGFVDFIFDLDDELKANQELIKDYKARIAKLEKRNKFLLEQKAKNPKLYEKKPLYEETKNAYIYRVKLNGAEAKNISFVIKDHVLSIEMNIKTEHKDKNSYYASSRYFFQQYSIPSDVDESKIKNSVDGDYFVITMPKKR
jgi:HSP20 family molecular chaperone IbpA